MLRTPISSRWPCFTPCGVEEQAIEDQQPDADADGAVGYIKCRPVAVQGRKIEQEAVKIRRDRLYANAEAVEVVPIGLVPQVLVDEELLDAANLTKIQFSRLKMNRHWIYYKIICRSRLNLREKEYHPIFPLIYRSRKGGSKI